MEKGNNLQFKPYLNDVPNANGILCEYVCDKIDKNNRIDLLDMVNLRRAARYEIVYLDIIGTHDALQLCMSYSLDSICQLFQFQNDIRLLLHIFKAHMCNLRHRMTPEWSRWFRCRGE